MSDMLLILLIASVVIIAWAVYENRRYSRIVAAEKEESGLSVESLDALGATAVATMTSRVEAIMRRHRRDRCIAVALTSGADSGPASAELHHLLPGDPVWIQVDEEKPDTVNVFSAGYKVGAISGPDAEKAKAIMKDNELKASYVCQQDCYEYYEKVAVRLIIFYQPQGEVVTAADDAGFFDGVQAEAWLNRGASAFVQETAADKGLLDGLPYRMAPGTISAN